VARAGDITSAADAALIHGDELVTQTGRFYAIIPAGGSGTRLWPVSRSARPKFLLPLPGPRTMIQETVQRLAPLCDRTDVFIITGQKHAEEVRTQLPGLDPGQVVVEPVARGSGPAIGLGAAIAYTRDSEAIVGSFAADHVVTEPAVFENAVRTAIDIASRGYLVTIGIQPSYPETGYGYICAGDSIGIVNDLDVCVVDEFKEKPDLETATCYVESGRYLWNASMFVWQAKTLLDELRAYLPDVASALEQIAAVWDTPDRDRVMQEIWPAIEEVTIDHGILEKSDRVAVVPGTFGWTDLGDWHGYGKVVAEFLTSNAQTMDPSSGNGHIHLDVNNNLTIHADLLSVDATNAVVIGNGRLVALLGVNDLVVIDTDDAVLVCDRARAQDVRHLVDELKRQGSTTLI
jgi:mannose-1-phosphate guanylyltransferase